MDPNALYRMTERLKLLLFALGHAGHVDEFGGCVGVLEGEVGDDGPAGPRAFVRWLPSQARHAYLPEHLEQAPAGPAGEA